MAQFLQINFAYRYEFFATIAKRRDSYRLIFTNERECMRGEGVSGQG
jgi:hypothetical protein